MKNLKFNLPVLSGEQTCLGQVVATDPSLLPGALVCAKFFSIPFDAQMAIHDVVGAQNDDFHAKGVMELSAHFFLEPFADSIDVPFN